MDDDKVTVIVSLIMMPMTITPKNDNYSLGVYFDYDGEDNNNEFDKQEEKDDQQ